MARVKRGKSAHKRRKKVIKQAKGFKWGRKSKYKSAKDALYHAWEYSYRDRKKNKGNFRALWQNQINSACKKEGISYNKFISGLKKNKIELDRKILANFVRENPSIFKKIIEKLK